MNRIKMGNYQVADLSLKTKGLHAGGDRVQTSTAQNDHTWHSVEEHKLKSRKFPETGILSMDIKSATRKYLAQRARAELMGFLRKEFSGWTQRTQQKNIWPGVEWQKSQTI